MDLATIEYFPSKSVAAPFVVFFIKTFAIFLIANTAYRLVQYIIIKSRELKPSYCSCVILALKHICPGFIHLTDA